MLARDLTGLAMACLVTLLIEPGAAQAQSVHGGPWLGGYWPTGTALYTLVEPVAAEDGAERHTQAEIEHGGALIGLRGSIRPRRWPVGVRLTLAQMQGGEARTTSAVYRPCEGYCLFPIQPSSGAIYTSDLTITVAQLDAVVEPTGRLGPVTPQLLLGLTTRHHNYGVPRLEETLGTADTAHPTVVRFPEDKLGVALHLGSSVSVPLLGREFSVQFGDHMSLDARSVGADRRAEPFLRHDLYLGAGFTLF